MQKKICYKKLFKLMIDRDLCAQLLQASSPEAFCSFWPSSCTLCKRSRA